MRELWSPEMHDLNDLNERLEYLIFTVQTTKAARGFEKAINRYSKNDPKHWYFVKRKEDYIRNKQKQLRNYFEALGEEETLKLIVGIQNEITYGLDRRKMRARDQIRRAEKLRRIQKKWEGKGKGSAPPGEKRLPGRPKAKERMVLLKDRRTIIDVKEEQTSPAGRFTKPPERVIEELVRLATLWARDTGEARLLEGGNGCPGIMEQLEQLPSGGKNKP